ncbi:hypothetical protein BIW11_12007 [Tropilaelaps mercedesae]|uniref:Uncharacterized protein n=1 Tax=Tropilaelaps mercedesae TaxID=418985 RepID=A0A1V9X953_9ACAR|nr:hypothetical protein BIW11_12007 [Tropilaelaps mercedesae]
MTREERKLDAIMRAFEKLEQKQKRKQITQEHKQVPGKDKEEKRKSGGSGRGAGGVAGASEGSSDKRTPSAGSAGGSGDAVCPVGSAQASAKKGRRKSSSGTPMKRGRARTISGCSDTSSLHKDGNASNDCFAQPAKSKRLLMQGWLQEKHNGAELSSPGGESPSTGASTPGQEVNNKGEESVCFVRESHSVANAMAHLRRSNSVSTNVTGQVSQGGVIGTPVGVNSNCGAGSAKKRWLRQAMCDDGDSTPEAPNSPSNVAPVTPSQPPAAAAAAASSPPTDAPAPLEEDNHQESGHGSGPDYVTPLKKRRLMRESVDSAASPVHESPHRSPHESANDEHDDDYQPKDNQPKPVDDEALHVDVVQVGAHDEPPPILTAAVTCAPDDAATEVAEPAANKAEHSDEDNHESVTEVDAPVNGSESLHPSAGADERDLVVNLDDNGQGQATALSEASDRSEIASQPAAESAAAEVSVLQQKEPSDASNDSDVHEKSSPSDKSDSLSDDTECSRRTKERCPKKDKEVKFANEFDEKSVKDSPKEKEQKPSKEKDVGKDPPNNRASKDAKPALVLLPPKEPKSSKDANPKDKEGKSSKSKEPRPPKAEKEAKPVKEKELRSPKERESRSPKLKDTSKKDSKRADKEAPSADTTDPFSRALVKEDRRPKDKTLKDRKEKHRKERKDDKRGRDTKERSSVDEPVEEPRSASSTGIQQLQAGSPTTPKTGDADCEHQETDSSCNPPSQHVSTPLPAEVQAAEAWPMVTPSNENKADVDVENKEEKAAEDTTEVEAPRPTSESSWEPAPTSEASGVDEATDCDGEENVALDGATTPTQDEMENDDVNAADDGETDGRLPDAPVRLPPSEALKAPSSINVTSTPAATPQHEPVVVPAPARDRKKRVSLSEYLKRQRSEPGPPMTTVPPATTNNNNNNNSLLRSPLNSGPIKLAPISNELLGSFAKLTSGGRMGVKSSGVAAISPMSRSKSISDPTSPLTHLPSTIRSSLPAAVTAPPMQLLSPSLSASGSSVLHKSALFPDTPERDRDREHIDGATTAPLVDAPMAKRREPLTQRLRREFGLLAANDDVELTAGASSSIVSSTSSYAGANSFPTATVQTPSGPQQVYYVPQPASGSTLCPGLTAKQPGNSLSPLAMTAASASAAARGFKTAGSLSSARPRANTGGAGAGYKPGYY